MTVSTQIPETWKIPLFWANVDGSMAGYATQQQPALLVGQMTTSGANAGTAALNVPIPIGSPALAENLFGMDSMLADMCRGFFKVNTTTLLYAAAVADPAAGAIATGSLIVATPPTAGGTLFLQTAGQLVQVAVGSTDSVSTIATNIAAAINVTTSKLPITASPSSGTVNLTCKFKGAIGNDIQIIANYLGAAGGQVYPLGLTLTINPMSGGTGQPDCTALIANIQALAMKFVGLAYNDPTTEGAWAAEYGFGSDGRWSFTRQQYGFVLNAYRNSYASTIARGQSTNAPVISSMAIEQLVPSPIWSVAAVYCGLAALGFTDDPARPLQTLEMLGVLPAQIQSRYSQLEQNNLLNSGLAVQYVDAAGNMAIGAEQTQYQLNQYGQADSAYGLLTVLATLDYLLSSMRSAITSKYARVKLVADGTAFGLGQAIISPSVIKAELVALFRTWQLQGLVQDITAFTNNLVVEIDSANPNRVNVLWPPQLAGQLRTFAVLAQFRLLPNYPVPVQ